MNACNFVMGVIGLISASVSIAAIPIGAAPKGEAIDVASRIIKYNFPECKRVTRAVRQADGSIRAACDGVQYLVFTCRRWSHPAVSAPQWVALWLQPDSSP